MPFLRLPEIRLNPFPPMTLFEPLTTTPSALPTANVPEPSVPIRLPATVLLLPVTTTPARRLPEMLFISSATREPMKLFVPSTTMPLPRLATAAVRSPLIPTSQDLTWLPLPEVTRTPSPLLPDMTLRAMRLLEVLTETPMPLGTATEPVLSV